MTDWLNVDDVWVVVPTVRPESLKQFLARWSDTFNNRLVIVEDAPQTSQAIATMVQDRGLHISRHDGLMLFGEENAWMIPARSDSVRCLGVLLAHRAGAKVILTLDDDCYPPPDSKSDWLEHLVCVMNSSSVDAWTSTISGDTPRGLPYAETIVQVPVHVNHGLWLNVPDLDAPTQLHRQRHGYKKIRYPNQIISSGLFFPMCSMNLAWRREMTPAMFFMLMGDGWPFNRFADIWCGLFMKRVADHLGLHVRSGDPLIWHERASDPFVNLTKEASGLPVNEKLWRRVHTTGIDPSACTVPEAYCSLVRNVDLTGLPEPGYWPKLKEAMLTWCDLCMVG